MGGSVSAWFHTSPLWRRLLSGGPCASMRALQMLLAAGWTQQAVHGMGWSVRACFICGSGCSWLAATSMPGCAHPQMLPAARQTGHAAHGMGGSVSRWSLGGCHMTARPWALSAAMQSGQPGHAANGVGGSVGAVVICGSGCSDSGASCSHGRQRRHPKHAQRSQDQTVFPYAARYSTTPAVLP